MKTHGAAKYAVYFGDQRANEYAVDAATGELLWKQRVEDHPLARIVGAPKLYNGRLYVPVSSGEEGISASSSYPCCTFRGSVVALDAETGKQIWKTYSIPETPKPTKKNSAGTQLSGPAGAAIWNSPTIDVKRNALYVGTGDAYTEPAAKTSDAILALDLDTGKMLWSFQDIKKDSWMVGCDGKHIVGNCPEELGPDYDFSVSPMLRTLSNGRQFLVVSGKSGYVLALDPDKKGRRVVEDSSLRKAAILFRADRFWRSVRRARRVFCAESGRRRCRCRYGDGRAQVVYAACPGGHPGRSAAPRAVRGRDGDSRSGVFGRMGRQAPRRRHWNGSVIWEYNTVRDYTTVNGVPGKGGSMGAPGATVVGGMLYVGSGYVGVSNGLPGNVLLAFSAQ